MQSVAIDNPDVLPEGNIRISYRKKKKFFFFFLETQCYSMQFSWRGKNFKGPGSFLLPLMEIQIPSAPLLLVCVVALRLSVGCCFVALVFQ